MRLALILLVSCGAKLDLDGTALGGETHFLVTCGQGCGEGLSCIEGVCTSSCEPGFSSCSTLGTLAECVGPSQDSADRVPFGGKCDVLCNNDLDCTSLGSGYSCRSGACRAEPEDRHAALALGAKSAPLVRAVDADTCFTGLRWVGGDRPSAEMHPGSDCMECHGETSKRPLLLGGTVYPIGGGRASPPLDDCFGIEGVEVTITDADGRVRSTLTNRAGNFYFEGRASEIAMPYNAALRWNNREGKELNTPMFYSASYGGCARCHADGLRPNPSLFDRDPEWVLPAGSVIHLPGLYPNE
ncbi:MAG TPA: carboxypeptidase-like regulatory domain-containing protein [Polyangiaceae bacterium]|nr:carboxypeptidase-like regulatory domain-containing protein [Polyangiaceae bacterium]